MKAQAPRLRLRAVAERALERRRALLRSRARQEAATQ